MGFDSYNNFGLYRPITSKTITHLSIFCKLKIKIIAQGQFLSWKG